jgi:hypothetical protein
MTGRVMGALVALAALAGPAGCTPAVAAVNVGERPTLLIVNCSDLMVDSIRVDADGEAKAWTLRTDSKPGPARITLFEAPEGWTVEHRTLTELSAGVQYTATAFGRGRRAVPVQFTVDALNELNPGEVLVGEPGSVAKAMSEKDYRENAADAC